MKPSLDEKLAALGQISQKKLLDILTRIPGKKDLIIDSTLLKPLQRIIGVKELRDSGVDELYKLEKSEIPFSNTQRVFLINADLTTLKRVSDKISGEISKENDGNSYHIILVGRKLQSLVNLLENEGTLGYVVLYVLQWELMKLDTRFLSLEYHRTYRSLFVENDQSCLPTIAKSIWTLNMILGKPMVTVTQGKYSHLIAQILDKMYEKLGAPSKEGGVECALIVDRDVDYASTLLTGSTYSCLLDEVFGIRSGIVEIKEEKNPTPGGYFLSSSDEIYSQIKSRHFSDVFPYLRQKTKELTQTKNKFQTMDISDMKTFVKTELGLLTNFKNKLAYHINACESIISNIGNRYEGLQNAEHNILSGRSRRETIAYIEDCLAMNTCDKFSILRLMCLVSLAQDGFFSDELQRLKLQYFHMFGYKHLTTFHALEKAGLCVEQPALVSTEVKGGHLANKVAQEVPLPARRSAFKTFAQKLKLFPTVNDDDYGLSNPTDPSYVFGLAYIPAMCQIVHGICKKEISYEDLTKMLSNCSVKLSENEVKPNKGTFLVYIVGGVTYAELSAFQLLEKLTDCQVIVASTSTISGNTIMKSFF